MACGDDDPGGWRDPPMTPQLGLSAPPTLYITKQFISSGNRAQELRRVQQLTAAIVGSVMHNLTVSEES